MLQILKYQWSNQWEEEQHTHVVVCTFSCLLDTHANTCTRYDKVYSHDPIGQIQTWVHKVTLQSRGSWVPSAVKWWLQFGHVSSHWSLMRRHGCSVSRWTCSLRAGGSSSGVLTSNLRFSHITSIVKVKCSSTHRRPWCMCSLTEKLSQSWTPDLRLDPDTSPSEDLVCPLCSTLLFTCPSWFYPRYVTNMQL